MQTHSFLTRAVLATAGLLFAAETNAALNYDEGDLIMAFRATGGTGASTNYIVNLGPKTQFIDKTSIITLSAQLGNFATDLNALYTSDWKTRVDFLWSITGVQYSVADYPARTMFMSRARAAGTSSGVAGSTAWPRLTLSASGSPAGKVLDFGLRYELGNGGAQPTGSTESTNSTVGLIQPKGGTQTYDSYLPGGANTTGPAAFGNFGGTETIEAMASLGLDFYTLQPGTGSSEFEGSFSIASNGTVTFTPAGVVPEPSAFIALGAGLVALTSIRRRALQR